MYPLDFEEFLIACGDYQTIPYLKKCFDERKPVGVLHSKMMKRFRTYLLVGGMPQAVEEYLKKPDFGACDERKKRILNLYEDDIYKFGDGREDLTQSWLTGVAPGYNQILTPTREGYVFDGWNEEKDGSGASYDATDILTLTSDVTLYAQWARRITFHDNLDSNITYIQTIRVGSPTNLETNKFVNGVTSFVGWTTSATDKTIKYTNGASVTLTGDDATDITDLYAQWILQEYNITYHLNGGVNSDLNTLSHFNVENETFSIYAPDKNDWPLGYQFGGWFTDNAYKNRINEKIAAHAECNVCGIFCNISTDKHSIPDVTGSRIISF